MNSLERLVYAPYKQMTKYKCGHSHSHHSKDIEKGEIKLNCHSDMFVVLKGTVWLERDTKQPLVAKKTYGELNDSDYEDGEP